MSKATASMSDWFGLKDGKENFSIIPERDQAFLFGKAQWRDQIEDKLNVARILKEPVRLVWWGDFGIGKTQRLQYMHYLIEHEELEFCPINVICRDLIAKSGFDALHFDLVNNIGESKVHEMVEGYNEKLRTSTAGAVPFEQLSAVQDVANAMDRMGDKDEQLRRAAWRFLTGLKLEKGERPLAHVSKDKIDSSVEYASVLKCLAWVVHVELGKQLLLLIDQLETLTSITNRDFENAWVETLRAVLDTRELGVVCTVGAMRQELLPTIMLRPEILSRFKQDNYLRLSQYEAETAEDFLKDLLREWIDPERRDKAVQKHRLDQTAGYSLETYPFTESAFTSFCLYLTSDPRDAKPREILERLNRVAAYACLEGVPLITKSELLRQGISA